MLRKHMVELRRAARLYAREQEQALRHADSWQALNRLTEALATVQRESRGPLADACKEIRERVSLSHGERYRYTSDGHDEIKRLCEFIGVAK